MLKTSSLNLLILYIQYWPKLIFYYKSLNYFLIHIYNFQKNNKSEVIQNQSKRVSKKYVKYILKKKQDNDEENNLNIYISSQYYQPKKEPLLIRIRLQGVDYVILARLNQKTKLKNIFNIIFLLNRTNIPLNQLTRLSLPSWFDLNYFICIHLL